MKIVGLGSCRIHNPLAAMAKRGKVQYVNDGFGSGGHVYMHAPNEMIQFYQIITGQISLNSDIAKYVYLSSAQPVSPAIRAKFNEADAAVIEICTNKEYSALGYSLNINEVYRVTAERAGPVARRWWETVGKDEKVDANLAAAVKAELESGGAQVSEIDELVIRDLKLARLSAAQMRNKIAELVSLLGRPVVIVPHIRVRIASGEWVENRNVHVAMVLDAARALNLSVLDPYELVSRDGQAQVLASDGNDFNHYAEGYLPIVGEAIIGIAAKSLAENCVTTAT